jgi:hypothetical protein
MALNEKLTHHPVNRAIRLTNVNCPYCGGNFDVHRPRTKEHVIGRRFVPRGTLGVQWNLILQACEPCNQLKAGLEDDISAITMLPDLAGRYAVEDARLKTEALRKAANARSRRTGKLVRDSREEFQWNGSFGPATFTFNFLAPPQIDERRILHLAYLHVSAFFFYITYQPESRRGGFVLGEYHFLEYVRRGDWGNSRLLWFMDLVRNWDPRMNAIGADGFFKLMIRKMTGGPNVWAWAVEWNCEMRVTGFAGDVAKIEEIAKTAPSLPVQRQDVGPDEWVAFRTDQALSEGEDDLFAV